MTENKTLKLVLVKKWFDMIKSGKKKEEYREIKPYWVTRICEKQPLSVIDGGDIRSTHDNISYVIKRFDFVKFKNGYRKDAPTVTFKIDDIEINTGRSEWGAVDDQIYFVIKLGKQIN